MVLKISHSLKQSVIFAPKLFHITEGIYGGDGVYSSSGKKKYFFFC